MDVSHWPDCHAERGWDAVVIMNTRGCGMKTIGDGTMADTKKREINGVTFQVSPFMAVEGLRLKAHLIRTFGPALAELLGGMNLAQIGDIGNFNLGGVSFASGIEKLMEQLSEDSFIDLLKRLFTNVIASWNEGGKSWSIAFNADFDTAMQLVFTGRLFTVYPLIGLVLEVNYPDFFDKVVKGIGRRIPKIATSETDAGTSTLESSQSGTLEN